MTRPTITVGLDTSGQAFGINPTYVDISDYVDAIPSIRRGRQNALGRYEAGTADIVLENKDGYFTPDNPRSPFAEVIRPMTRISISMTVGMSSVPLFIGYVESWPPVWPGGLISTTTIRCVDAFKLFALAKIDFMRSAEMSHDRVNALLDAIGWPDAQRTIVTSVSDVRSGKSEIADVALTQTPALSHFQDVIEAEDGAFFISSDGLATFQGRHWRLGYTTSIAVQATFGNDFQPTVGWVLGNAINSVIGVTTIPRETGFASFPELPFLRVDPSYDDSFLYNDAQITPDSGSVQTAEDATSIARYGRRTYARSLLLVDEGDAQDRADWLIAQNKDPKLRFLRLVISGLSNDTIWGVIPTLDISMRILVVVRPPGSFGIGRECYIEGIEHRNITINEWQTIYTLSPANGVGGGVGAWVLQDAELGILESTTRLTY